MTDFIPETPKDEQDVPYYDEVTSEGGWQGHRTRKTIAQLKLEISGAITRLGGMITSWQSGDFGNRRGFRINYILEGPTGQTWPGRLDIAALPTRSKAKKRQEESLKMALYMVGMALSGSWFLKQLSPGSNPLIPWMLMQGKGGGEFTLSEAITGMGEGQNLLPEPDNVIEGEFRETD